MEVGHLIVVTIKRIGINGEGVGYFRKKAVFVPGALTGEIVKARVAKIEPNYIQATLAEIETPSPDRVQPFCALYDQCGGCQMQHMSYEAQLRAKQEHVREAFARYAGLEQPPIRPILGMDNPLGYRNKASLQVGLADKDRLVTGLYSPNSHKLVDISGCPIQDPAINAVMEGVKRALKEVRVPVYHEKTRQGLLRTVVARVSRLTGKVQLTLVTSSRELPGKLVLIRHLRRELPQVVGISQNVNPGRTPLVFGEETIHLWGQEQLEEKLGSVKFSLSPRSFFQLNPIQTVKLYDAVKEAAALTGSERVVDAYCGSGTIGLWLAPQAKEIRGIELVPEAVEDACRNALASGADNATFHVGRAEKLLPAWVRDGFRPDVLVVDPPRTGCDDALLAAALEVKPERFVYVSCNPSTLAKDCAKLIAGGYRLEWIQPVDMFPHTSHVECCVLLVRK
ncbi:23S rRNA (uracil(1939)-C(5))-methyltransferase RlmD [Paenibacillus thermoaerophilus]|nr:23S rRNA (uracil(1939)-C(5))-methyltransferase RlmD [Paenibacillus thermoaerophilus]